MTLYALQESTWSYMSGSSHFAGIKEEGIWKKSKRAPGVCGVVQTWGWRGKEKIIISCWHYYVLSERQGRQFTTHQCCLWSSNCIQSLKWLPSQVSHKTTLRSVLRVNLLNILAEGRWEDRWNLITPFWWETLEPCSAENKRGKLILVECIYSLISSTTKWVQDLTQKLSILYSLDTVDLNKEGVLWLPLCFYIESMVSGSEILHKSLVTESRDRVTCDRTMSL